MNEISDEQLEQRLLAGDDEAFAMLLTRYRDRLSRMVELRMDRRLKGRVDPADIVQDASLEATVRIERFRTEQPMPFYLWLRFLVGEQIFAAQRKHLGAAKRDARLDVSIYQSPLPYASSAMLAAQLVGSFTAPSQAFLRSERLQRLQVALDAMKPLDREIIALRHFEQLSRRETAECLGIQESATSKRYIRALAKLREVLDDSSQSNPEFP